MPFMTDKKYLTSVMEAFVHMSITNFRLGDPDTCFYQFLFINQINILIW